MALSAVRYGASIPTRRIVVVICRRPTTYPSATSKRFILRLGVKDQALNKIGLSAVGALDANSRLKERIYVEATRYIYDALDRLHERPVAVFEVGAEPDGPVLANPTWQIYKRPDGGLNEKKSPPLFAQGAGRVRLLHVLLSRLRSEDGFEEALRRFPDDFFGRGSEGNPEYPDDPPGAAGQVLGISRPVEWRRNQSRRDFRQTVHACAPSTARACG